MNRRFLPLLLLCSAPVLAHAEASKGRVVVVSAPGVAGGREVAGELTARGYQVDLAPEAPPAAPVLLETARGCLNEGHDAAFRLDFPGAIKALSECEANNGAVLARPEGVGVLGAILVERAAAELQVGHADRARVDFQRLARLPDAPPPDPALFPPEVISTWESARKSAGAGRPVAVEVVPPWALVWIDGKRAGPLPLGTGLAPLAAETGEKMDLAPGPHLVAAEAPGFTAFAGSMDVQPTGAVVVRLTSLDPDARRAAVQAGAAKIAPGLPGAAAELTAAFGAPVVVVAALEGAPDAVLLTPAEPGGAAAAVAGHFHTAGGAGAARTIATAVVSRLESASVAGVDEPFVPAHPPTRKESHTTLYVVGGAVLGALAVGAAAYALSNQNSTPGQKTGTVTWNP